MPTNIDINLPNRFKKNLIAYWKGDGNAKDSVGQNHGTLSPTGVTFAKGRQNKAFSFDGTVGNVVTPLITSYKNGLTFDLWIKTTADSGMILSDGGGATRETGMGLFIEPGGNLMVMGTNAVPGVGNFGSGQYIINDNKWHHIIATWTGTTKPNQAILYVDGDSKGYGTAKASIDKGTKHFCIGGHDKIGYDKFKGLIDEVKIYNRALKPSEIRELRECY